MRTRFSDVLVASLVLVHIHGRIQELLSHSVHSLDALPETIIINICCFQPRHAIALPFHINQSSERRSRLVQMESPLVSETRAVVQSLRDEGRLSEAQNGLLDEVTRAARPSLPFITNNRAS